MVWLTGFTVVAALASQQAQGAAAGSQGGVTGAQGGYIEKQLTRGQEMDLDANLEFVKRKVDGSWLYGGEIAPRQYVSFPGNAILKVVIDATKLPPDSKGIACFRITYTVPLAKLDPYRVKPERGLGEASKFIQVACTDDHEDIEVVREGFLAEGGSVIRRSKGSFIQLYRLSADPSKPDIHWAVDTCKCLSYAITILGGKASKNLQRGGGGALRLP